MTRCKMDLKRLKSAHFTQERPLVGMDFRWRHNVGLLTDSHRPTLVLVLQIGALTLLALGTGEAEGSVGRFASERIAFDQGRQLMAGTVTCQ